MAPAETGDVDSDAAVADIYLTHGIPLIAADIPYPGATYFGANNYEAGLLAGRHLGRWAKAHWGGQPDQLLLLDISRGGPALQMRVRGMLTGIKEQLDIIDHVPVSTLDGDAAFKRSLEVVRRWLRGTALRRVLVGAQTTPAHWVRCGRSKKPAGQLLRCSRAKRGARSPG